MYEEVFAAVVLSFTLVLLSKRHTAGGSYLAVLSLFPHRHQPPNLLSCDGVYRVLCAAFLSTDAAQIYACLHWSHR